MPAVGLGHKSYIQFGRESTWGTAVAATKRTEIVDWNVDLVPGFARDPSLNNQRSRRNVFPAGQFWRGTFKVRLNFLDIGHLTLLDAVFGTSAFGSKGVVTTGAGPTYTHTFKELPLLNSYTVEIIEGDIPSTTQCMRMFGAKFRSITFTVEAVQGEAAFLMAEFEVIAKDVTDSFTRTSALTAAVPSPILFHHATTVDDGINTSGIVVKSARFNMRQPTTEADRLGLGSTLINEPLPNEFMEAMVEFREEFKGVELLQAAKAGTPGSPELLFTNTHTFQILAAEAIITGYSNPIRGYGLIESTVGWEAYSTNNPTTSPLKVVVVNTLDGTTPPI